MADLLDGLVPAAGGPSAIDILGASIGLPPGLGTALGIAANGARSGGPSSARSGAATSGGTSSSAITGASQLFDSSGWTVTINKALGDRSSADATTTAERTQSAGIPNYLLIGGALLAALLAWRALRS